MWIGSRLHFPTTPYQGSNFQNVAKFLRPAKKKPTGGSVYGFARALCSQLVRPQRRLTPHLHSSRGVRSLMLSRAQRWALAADEVRGRPIAFEARSSAYNDRQMRPNAVMRDQQARQHCVISHGLALDATQRRRGIAHLCRLALARPRARFFPLFGAKFLLL